MILAKQPCTQVVACGYFSYATSLQHNNCHIIAQSKGLHFRHEFFVFVLNCSRCWGCCCFWWWWWRGWTCIFPSRRRWWRWCTTVRRGWWNCIVSSIISSICRRWWRIRRSRGWDAHVRRGPVGEVKGIIIATCCTRSPSYQTYPGGGMP